MSKPRAADAPQIPVAAFLEAGQQVPDPDRPQAEADLPGVVAEWQLPPHIHLCRLNLQAGCYQLHITRTPVPRPPRLFASTYRLGTLRVQQDGGSYAISGDTYRYSWFDILFGGGIPSFGPTTIPVYPRGRYNSYLKVTAVNIPRFSFGPCRIHMTVEEYDYTQPAAGSFDGSFPTSPSRVMDLYLTPTPAPAGYTGAYFTGQVYIGGVLQTALSVTLAWCSPALRKATVEVHTMTGSVAPAAVGGEYFDTIYAKANWDVSVISDPNPVPVPVTNPPTDPTAAWSSAALHGVMTSLSDFAAVNLDAAWHMHVLVVQAHLGCGRGVMFDTINVPREGVASFCEDGYPSGDSAWFETAANQMQKNVPRAFLRSATHEITHGFNQIHQENEAGADNSIMTTTPSVANTIHSNGGTFPDDITLDFNEHVRHHLRHLPDPVVRPGGMTFTAGHNGIPIPSEDEEAAEIETLAEHPGLALTLKARKARVKIGEPLQLEWALANTGSSAIKAPSHVGIEHDFAEIAVVKPDGSTHQVAPYVIVCDESSLTDLAPGERRSATHDLFWSTQGFSFEQPGRHTVTVEVAWSMNGLRVGASATLEVLVDHPVDAHDNEVIAHMMHPEVGKFVALGGHAYHLSEAVARIGKVVKAHAAHDVAQAVAPMFDAKRIAPAAKSRPAAAAAALHD